MTFPDLVRPPDTRSPLDLPALLEAARNYVEAARAPNTRRAYRSQWKTFPRSS